MSSSSQVPESWIAAFCSLVGHEYFAEVSEDFIEDDFNLTGLQSQVAMYKEALEMILDVEPEDASDEEEEDEDDDDEPEEKFPRLPHITSTYKRSDNFEREARRRASDLDIIETNAELLYGLIHQRYITSRQGIQQMAEKYEYGHFGQCPRVHCGGSKVLPVGCSDIPGEATVKLFCPSCLDIYNPPNSRFLTVDGAFFGTTFGCLFFMTFPELDVAGKNLKAVSASHTDTLASETGDRGGRSSLSSSLNSNQQTINPAAAPASLPQQPIIINGIATKNLAPGLGPGAIYEPKIYGFRVSEVAKTGPRMKWLRSKPADINELDECTIYQRSMGTDEAKDQAKATDASAVGDSEMAEANEEVDDGEVEDQDMDNGNEQLADSGAAPDQTSEVRELAAERKKNAKRREDGLTNGDSGGTAVTVGS